MKRKNSRTKKVKKDRTKNDKGILLEQIVAMLHQDENVKVETNVKLPPKSGSRRKVEIDVLLTSEVAGYPVKIAIQCKNYDKKITREQIGAFRDSLEDVGIPVENSIVVSVKGFQSGAIERAKELGVKTFILEGLDETRLNKEIREIFQYFVYLLLVVEEMKITSKLSGYYVWMFWDNEKNLIGFVTDLIVNAWRNGEVPMKLGEYSINLKLPKEWCQVLGNKLVYPESISAKVRVVGYLAEMKGKFEEFKLKEADSDKVEKFRLQANFDVINNLIKVSQEEPIFSEEELDKSKGGTKINVENRIRLPKIFVTNHLEPFSEKAFNFFLKTTENLTLEEIEKLPIPTIEEFEGNTFDPMQEKAALGEPVIIEDQNKNLIDIRLLFRQERFAEIIELAPLLQKFPRKDFADYLSEAFLSQGEIILEKSLKDKEIQNVLKTQAFNMFDKSIALSSDVIDTYLSLGIIFRNNNFFDKSIKCLEYILSVESQNLLAKGSLAETYFRMGNSSKALKLLNEIFKENKEIPLTIVLFRSKVFASEKKYREAGEDLFNVWENNYKLIVEDRKVRFLAFEIYNNFKVIGTAIILVDICLYNVSTFADEGKLKESKNHLEDAVALLEHINQICVRDSLTDFRNDSLKPVLLEANDIISKNLSYSTKKWKNRVQILIKSID